MAIKINPERFASYGRLPIACLQDKDGSYYTDASVYVTADDRVFVMVAGRCAGELTLPGLHDRCEWRTWSRHQANRINGTAENVRMADREKTLIDRCEGIANSLSRGGNDAVDNIAILVNAANRAKGQMTVEEFVELCCEVASYSAGYMPPS